MHRSLRWNRLVYKDIPRHIAERVLLSGQKRLPPQIGGASNGSPMPHVTCRRKTLLREEGIPDEVAARIFGQDPVLRRSRQSKPEGLRAQPA